ncbi:beta-lactamase/transpeptidase-like protein [Macroventuria anomochaeta]|uniref:Beta-lactamase/transpeptidase-like protein n=1 Tax=Macroventuria anomochaeta TaxID=301207 RepID=A0ACB6SDG6_9PLEO|nr:beta-lactamase/transpeptidase-like protein [Macroventuria anomochaeta]KAF2632355.1 beta-lactamase/transpeptidase-like protein [Macroventuria anomochaeta]
MCGNIEDIDDGHMFGASVIIARGGKIGLRKTYGTVTASGRSHAKDDLYLTMPLSKSSTAALVLRAIDYGVSLSTRKKREITVRQCLTHTAGMYPEFSPPGLATIDIGDLETYVRNVSAMPLLVATDTKEQSFSQIAREELFQPAGTKETVYRLNSNDPRRVPGAFQNHTGELNSDAWTAETSSNSLLNLPANFTLLGGYTRGAGHHLTVGATASPGSFYAIGGGSIMWFVDPARDLSIVFVSVGRIEGLAHQLRFLRLLT